jgi:hypothetical protein
MLAFIRVYLQKIKLPPPENPSEGNEGTNGVASQHDNDAPYAGMIQIRSLGRRNTCLSACFGRLPSRLIVKEKQETSCGDASCKKSLWYDFLRRHYPHQVKGSKLDDFLSACKHKLPCIHFGFILHPFFSKSKPLFEK